MTVSREAATAAGTATPREILSWALYDFANSGYTTVVLTTVYSAYFVSVICGEASLDSGTATLLWTLAIAFANLVVLVSGPVLGAIADYRASKKGFLLVTTVTCVASTALLSLVGPGGVAWALPLVALSAIAFASGENLIAAFLPEITDEATIGRVSGYGWSLGYFGGLLTLAACLAYIQHASGRGLAAPDYVPVTLLITAAVFAVAATPTFLFLRERARPQPPLHPMAYFRAGYREVRSTLSRAFRLPDLFRFLGCLVLFQAGVSTVVVVAAIYAQEVMGFDQSQLIVLIMVVNLTAAAGAFAFGFAQDRYGSIPSLAVALLVWVAAILATLLADEAADLWLAGNLMGAAMGATQSGGRALIGRLTPVSRTGEFFGLWGMANRTAAILGPVSYGLLSHFSGGDHRLALLSTLGMFVAGLLLLPTVNEQRGIHARGEFE